MPLVDRATSRPHTIVTFRAAAGARYRDAFQLEVVGRRLGAIYMFGYAAEMLLKSAYFRLTGWSRTTAIAVQAMTAAKAQATGVYQLPWPGNLHDLSGWSRLLIHERSVRSVPFTIAFRNQLQSNVNRIYRNWRESLRYHDMRPYEREVLGVRTATNWLLTQYARL